MEDSVKRTVLEYIEVHKDDFNAYANTLLAMPELGYKETNTRQYILSQLQKMGCEVSTKHALTGLKTKLRGKNSVASVCLLGEMDAVINKEHPAADATTGAAHACGHFMQAALLLSAAQVFTQLGLPAQLDGDVIFMSVPAEEFIDLEYRNQQIQAGDISYVGGKQQLVHEGAFEDVDMAMMLHAQPDTPQEAVYLEGGSLGFISKIAEFYGKATHAAEPSKGVNALQAANIALAAINANRDSFNDADKIRVHPILTHGGSIVNSVPDYARLELYVRSKNSQSLQEVGRVVDRCLQAGATALGARVDIHSQAGYLPLRQSKELSAVFENVVKQVSPNTKLEHGIDMIGSSDIGDLSCMIPCIQPTIGGYVGEAHSKEFGAENMDFCLVEALKWLVITIFELLENGAEKALTVKEGFSPLYSKEEYIAYLNQFDKQ